jgi:hypothetical protein
MDARDEPGSDTVDGKIEAPQFPSGFIPAVHAHLSQKVSTSSRTGSWIAAPSPAMMEGVGTAWRSRIDGPCGRRSRPSIA